MGKPQKHTPRCQKCGRTLPHHLMRCVKLPSGRKVHYCPACQK